MTDELTETLRQAQRLGFFGAAPIERAMQHAEGFVAALVPAQPGMSIVDIGSGGGLPGLVLAKAFPDARVTLVDRREKRTDFLQRAVSRLGYQHVTVLAADVSRVIDAVASGETPTFDAVTARGFGPPLETLRLARRLIGPGGRVVISEPPDDDRWPSEVVSSLGFVSDRVGGVRRFVLAR